MTARRIARELAVIVMPQLPKDKNKLNQVELEVIVTKAVRMLCDYAKQNLQDANALLIKSSQTLLDTEIDHPNNIESIDELQPVTVTTSMLKEQVELLDRAIHFVSEALDIPEMVLHTATELKKFECASCGEPNEASVARTSTGEVKGFIEKLINTYMENRQQVDEFIKHAKAKWQVERMVSIDRDILRLACTEAFFLPEVPISVSISEAVELSHRFADAKAAKFINGVLGDLADEARYFRVHGVFKEKAPEDVVSEVEA